MEASVILSKCSVHGLTFGIRIEKQNGDWVRTWAFKIDEAKAKREGFDKTQITGSLSPSPGYPGCPYCNEANGFVVCSCGKMSCMSKKRVHEREFLACHWCGKHWDEFDESKSFNVSSGAY